jgi:hypothetical protein
MQAWFGHIGAGFTYSGTHFEPMPFTEEMMQQAQTETVEEEEVQEGEFVMDCSICDSMPEAQRAACLEGVGCEE